MAATRRSSVDDSATNPSLPVRDRDPQRALEIFTNAKKQYLSLETNAENLGIVIEMFETALSYDPSNSDISAYLNYAKRDLNGLSKKKRGVISTSTRGSRKSAAGGSKDDILAAYETEDESKDDEDGDLEDDDDSDVPSWDPLKTKKSDDDSQVWEES